ncbi:MAG: hypothetical protein V4467_04225 [Patescibacteria group bacterium]
MKNRDPEQAPGFPFTTAGSVIALLLVVAGISVMGSLFTVTRVHQDAIEAESPAEKGYRVKLYSGESTVSEWNTAKQPSFGVAGIEFKTLAGKKVYLDGTWSIEEK